MMKIFFDTEFTGLHQHTTLVSIGCVAEDGREFYAEMTDYDRSQADDWIRDNVIANLIYGSEIENRGWIEGVYTGRKGDTDFVAMGLVNWFSEIGSIQMISDCLSYDWVLFCNLWGHAFNIPAFVSPAPRDINQDMADYLDMDEKVAFDYPREKFAEIEDVDQKHNALWDAKVIKACYEKLMGISS